MAAGDENPSPPPPLVNMEKPFGVTNIKTHVPLVLDLDQLNYDAWCELFMTHCLSFRVYGFLDGTTSSSSTTDTKWKKLDSLVKVWIYGTISTSLLQTVLKKNVLAKDVWKSFQDLFHANKEARAMELHEELRSMELGTLSIAEYFKKIKVTADLLANIDSTVDEKNLVMYAVNGLGDRYEHVASIIRHSKQPMNLLETRSMLLLDESRMNRKQNRNGSNGSNGSRGTPSSSTVLVATSNNKTTNNMQVCRNFLKGACKFGNNCRYLQIVPTGNHHNGMRSTSQWSNMGSRPLNHDMGYQTDRSFHHNMGPRLPEGYTGSHLGNGSHVNGTKGILGPYPPNGPHAAFGPTGVHVPSSSPGSNWGAQVVYGPLDQVAALPQSFNTMNIQDHGDPSWYMDIGATSHLASDTGSLDPPPASPM